MIGIVGGMGPLAGADLFEKLVRNVAAERDQDHLPVVLMSYPHRLPDRTAFLSGNSAHSPAPAIANILRSLDRLGVQVAGMPCNTAHAPVILEPVMTEMRRHNCRVELVNMIGATVASLDEISPSPKRIGILSTAGTRRAGLFRDAVRRAGHTPVELPDDLHDALAHRAVYDVEFGIKRHSAAPTPESRAWIIEGVERLGGAGAEAVILGCTELPLAVSETYHEGMPLVDPATALARELIRRTYPERLAPREPGPVHRSVG
jgi:aspartate racemase